MLTALLRRILRLLVDAMLFTTSLPDLLLSPKPSRHDLLPYARPQMSLQLLAGEISTLFLAPIDIPRMLSMSAQLRASFWAKLRDSPDCMLPSFSYALPTGYEKGTYLALDLGGSTFRGALVDLNGRTSLSTEPFRIRHVSSFVIDDAVRAMRGVQFFDYVAQQIEKIIADGLGPDHSREDAVAVGLAWSFPIEQTSPKGGKILGMGKGFHCHEDTIGQDLGSLLEAACRRRRLNVRLSALINDSSATLLCRAYSDPSTSMGLIVGTGMNAAVHLPTACFGPGKFGRRDEAWHLQAEKVVTNTELSMFGKGILPQTRWDETLNLSHQMPDFQPLEYMTTGRYLGEILRLIIVEAVETADLFGGSLPMALRKQYSLDTAILAKLDDPSGSPTLLSFHLQKLWALSSTPSKLEVNFLRTVARAISQRASAYLATAVHALWALQKEAEINPTTPHGTPKTSIACNGGVITKYPGFRESCQDYIDEMITSESFAGSFRVRESVALRLADDATILGAAVAVALAESE